MVQTFLFLKYFSLLLCFYVFIFVNAAGHWTKSVLVWLWRRIIKLLCSFANNKEEKEIRISPLNPPPKKRRQILSPFFTVKPWNSGKWNHLLPFSQIVKIGFSFWDFAATLVSSDHPLSFWSGFADPFQTQPTSSSIFFPPFPLKWEEEKEGLFSIFRFVKWAAVV